MSLGEIRPSDVPGLTDESEGKPLMLPRPGDPAPVNMTRGDIIEGIFGLCIEQCKYALDDIYLRVKAAMDGDVPAKYLAGCFTVFDGQVNHVLDALTGQHMNARHSYARDALQVAKDRFQAMSGKSAEDHETAVALLHEFFAILAVLHRVLRAKTHQTRRRIVRLYRGGDLKAVSYLGPGKTATGKG